MNNGALREKFFPGDSELATLMRNFDWANHELGSPDTWPSQLRIALTICLTSRFPMTLWWGPSLILFYNDAYIPFLGSHKHPTMLGRSSWEAWPEIWHIIGPMVKNVVATKNANWAEDMLMFIDRTLPKEEVYGTFSFNPIIVEDDTVGGLFCACTETTEKIIGARRLETLRRLNMRTTETQTVEVACKKSVQVLANNLHDIPFTAIYIIDETKKNAVLSALSGLSHSNLFPSTIALTEHNDSPWPLLEVIQQQQLIEVDLTALKSKLPGGPWPEPSEKAVVTLVSSSIPETPAGFLIAGVSPRRVLDAQYRAFFELIAGHIGTTIVDALAYDTERKRVETFAELDRAKTAFFSNISHEFRTPLTLMLAPLEDAIANITGTNQKTLENFLQIAHRNTLRLLKLVNTLLDFSRVEADRLKANFEATDLASTTKELTDVFRSAIERAGLLLTVECDPLPESVYVDREMWEKIVLNLISNAFKFTFKGEIKVDLYSTNNEVKLTVTDTGVGIAAEELPHIFKRFHRIEGTKARTHEGSGIGLALVQELISIHGGKIHVESILNVGTTFTVSLLFGTTHLPKECINVAQSPLATAKQGLIFKEEALSWLPEEENTILSSSSMEKVTEKTPQARILVADDNADMRNYLKRLLSKFWQVETVPDGLAAFNAVRQAHFDLVLTDVMMPQLNGFGLLKKLRADTVLKNIPVIMLSARAGKESYIKGLEAGADDYLIKPFSAHEVLARVETHLKSSARYLAKEKAEKNNRAKDIFLAILSHELRTPLTVILSWAQMLKTLKADPLKIQTGIQLIEESALTQNKIIDDLLDISKIILGKLSVELQEVDLAAVLKNTLASIQPAAKEKFIQIIEAVSMPNIIVLADPTRLKQIFWNLLSNAIKFTPKGGKIWVALNIYLNVKGEKPKVCIIIKDNGKGIKRAFLPHIFDRFSQADSFNSRSNEGLGLGLALVHSLLELHRGTIEAESEGEQKGSTFTVTLPFVIVPKTINLPHAVPNSILHEEHPMNLNLRGFRILLVEDNHKTREIIHTLLVTFGAEVSLASSAKEGLELFETVKPNIIVSDIAMPHEDGYSLIRKIREIEKETGSNTFAIALTAHAGEHNYERALAAGFNTHLDKPVTISKLVQTITGGLSHST